MDYPEFEPVDREGWCCPNCGSCLAPTLVVCPFCLKRDVWRVEPLANPRLKSRVFHEGTA